MDPYIRDFTFADINTRTVDSVDEFNNQFRALQNNFKIFHMNIRSIHENLNELLVFLKQFANDFDVLVLTETFKICDVSLYSLPGYSAIYNEGNINKNDGVVVYIRDDIQYDHKIVDIAGIKLIQVTLNINNNNILISAVYRLHPTCPYNFNENLKLYLGDIRKNLDYSIFLGDLNINILDQKDYTQDYLNILYEQGYISQINKYTRVCGDSKSCIDHIFVNQKKCDADQNLTPVIIQNLITDHYPVVLLVKFSDDRAVLKENKYKQFIDYTNLKQRLRCENWDFILTNDIMDLDSATEKFVSILQKHIQDCTVQKKFNRIAIPRKSWISRGLIKSIQIKNDLYRQTIQNTLDTQIKDKYKLYKNNLSKLIKMAKVNYYKREIDKNKTNAGQLYKSVKKICNQDTKTNKCSIHKIRLKNGEITENVKNIADSFNQHYINFGKQLALKINNKQPLNTTVKINKNSIFLQPVIESETISIINQLQSSKSPGLDKIKASTLKEIKYEIVKPFTVIINEILKQGAWPTVLKTGVVRPMFKAGDKLDIVNYRPITLISNIAKIAEKVIKNRMTAFLDKHDLLSDRQYGFREGRSTQDAISYITDTIYRSLDDNKPTLCMFVDLAKAFDTISHEILLQKLQRYGFRGNAYTLLQTYLEERVQYVQIEDCLSTAGTVKYGVPQGTVLGPLLFVIYINDLLAMQSKGKIISYADDTAVVYTGNTWEHLKSVVEDDFSYIKKWFDANLLTLNTDKTTFLTFSSYQMETIDSLGVADGGGMLRIQSSDSVKYLGVIIDKNIRWSLHIGNIVKKLRGLLPKFRLLKDYLDRNHLMTLYFSLVQSHLAYGIVGWGGAYNNVLKNLEVIQRRFLKIIFEKKRAYSSDLLYAEARALDIRQLFCYIVLIRQFKYKDNVTYLQHCHNTRQREVLCRTRRCSKTIGQRNFSYIEQKLFNILPNNIKAVISRNSYRKKVRNWLFSISRQIISDIINN